MKMSSVCSFIFMQISYFHKNGTERSLKCKLKVLIELMNNTTGR